MHYIKNFIRSLKNLWVWFPIIWKDRNWDYYYFFVLLEKKLKLMKEQFEKECKYMDVDEVVEEINVVLEPLHRLVVDDYISDEWNEYHKKHPNESKFVKDEVTGLYTVVNNNIDKEKLNALFEKEQHLKKDDLEFVFNTIKEKVLGWWS